MTQSPFAIDIEKVRQGKVEMQVHEKPAALELADIEGVTLDQPVTGHLTYSMSGSDIIIQGNLSTHYCSTCVRCLEPACADVNTKIRLFFLAKGDKDDPTAFDEEVEDLDVDYYSGELLDPLPQIRDAILLEIPVLPVCSEDCKGLCPQCGVNHNVQSCNCQQPEIVTEHDAWKNKLKGFKLE